MRRKRPAREDLPNRPRGHLVKPLTLGDLAGGPDTVLEIECDWCRHRGRLEFPGLIERFGADAPMRNLTRRFRCSRCGWHIVEAYPVGRHTTREDAWEKVTSYRPTRAVVNPPLDECRRVLRDAPRIADPAEQHRAYMHVLMDRWPDLGASPALMIVRALAPGLDRDHPAPTRHK